MHFTIATPERLLRATYDAYRRQIEFSDGRPPLKAGRMGFVLDALRQAFPDCWIMDQHGRSHPPLVQRAGT